MRPNVTQDEMEDELLKIAEEVRATIAWEQELGGAFGLSPSEVELQPVEAAPVQVLAPTVKPVSLEVLATEAARCTGCALHQGRTQSVFHRGSAKAELAFVGEGPGYHEDQQGLPFVGRAGELLDKMVKAMGYAKGEVYICNVVKCRPPENRTPKPDEAKACEPFLVGQLEIVKPKMIVALGRCAAENLGVTEPGSRGWRGKMGEWNAIPVMPTYHPAFLLRSPQFKKQVWNDLQAVMRALGRPVS